MFATTADLDTHQDATGHEQDQADYPDRLTPLSTAPPAIRIDALAATLAA